MSAQVITPVTLCNVGARQFDFDEYLVAAPDADSEDTLWASDGEKFRPAESGVVANCQSLIDVKQPDWDLRAVRDAILVPQLRARGPGFVRDTQLTEPQHLAPAWGQHCVFVAVPLRMRLAELVTALEAAAEDIFPSVPHEKLSFYVDFVCGRRRGAV